MRETAIIYGLVSGLIFLLIMGMRWLAPHLDRWEARQDAAEWEKRKPTYPRPNIAPQSIPRPIDATAVLVAMLRDAGYEDLAREVMRRVARLPFEDGPPYSELVQ